MTLCMEGCVRPLAPDILAGPARSRIGLRVDPVEGEDAEGGDAILTEILILIVTPDQHDIGVERVQCLAALAEPGDKPFPVLGSRGDRVGPFLPHRLGPARRVLQLLGNLLALQRAVEKPGHLPVGLDETGVMRDADTENIAHRATPWHAAPIAAFGSFYQKTHRRAHSIKPKRDRYFPVAGRYGMLRARPQACTG